MAKKELRHYAAQECERVLADIANLAGKVILLNEPSSGKGSAFAYCYKDNGVQIYVVDLLDGKKKTVFRSCVVGIPKPGHMSAPELLHLSQITPDIKGDREKLYRGYAFLEDGRYVGAVYLQGEAAAMEYVALQAPYQYRVMLCDSDDYSVLEVLDGKVIFPAEEAIQEYLEMKRRGRNEES